MIKKIGSIIEDGLDKITPKTEVSGTSKSEYDEASFQKSMQRLLKNNDLSLRYSQDGKCLFNVHGNIMVIASATHRKDFNPNDFEKFSNVKSKLLCELVNRKILICSYEHLLGPKSHRKVFKEVLEKRLKVALRIIEKTND